MLNIERAGLATLLAVALFAPRVTTRAQSISVIVDGTPMTFTDQQPIDQAGRVFVPMRAVFEGLGASVVYENGTINSTKGTRTISLHIGSPQATVDGQPVQLSTPPFIIGARTLIPLRFVAQALGAIVSWSEANATVYISTKGTSSTASTNRTVSTPPVWRPAAPIHVIFIERFSSPFAPEVDLRPRIRQYGLHIRDQGNRGTCTVFATTFLIEFRKAGAPGAPYGLQLSEEYLNWAGNKATGEDADGGFFTKFIPGFHDYGLATASEMPYRATYNPAHPDTPSAPTIAAAKAMFPVRYPFTIIKVWNDHTGMTEARSCNTLCGFCARAVRWPRESGGSRTSPR